jgi:prephenate dehydrogenase
MVNKMEDGFRLGDSRIAIIGLGLMGGSLALALKGKCAALYGIDSNRATLELALDKRIIDRADTDPARLGVLPQVDLVIVATPVPAIINFIQELPSLIQKPCIVLDLGSTKKDIVQAMSILPEYFDPIGGHPICGKEKLGLENADASLFQKAPFVVTPLNRTTPRARKAADQIISAVGARLIEMDAEEHDRALAFTSHLPFLVSSALIGTLPHEFAGLIGTGFRSTSRLAGTPSHMMMGVLQSNRENILLSLRKFQEQLAVIEFALASKNDPSLEKVLNSTQSHYQSMIH